MTLTTVILAAVVTLGAAFLAILAALTRGELDYTTTSQEHTHAQDPSSVDAVLAARRREALRAEAEVLADDQLVEDLRAGHQPPTDNQVARALAAMRDHARETT